MLQLPMVTISSLPVCCPQQVSVGARTLAAPLALQVPSHHAVHGFDKSYSSSVLGN